MKSSQQGTSYQYDALGRVLTTTNALSQQTATTYSTVSLTLGVHGANALEQTTVVDANGHQTVSFTDAWGRLVVSETFTGSAAPYALYQQTQDWYDLNGHLAQIIHPDGTSTTTYTYDGLGHQTAMTDPDRGHETYQYDADGNLIQSVDARGASGTVYAGYDGLNRQTWRNTANSPTGAYVTYSYDSTANGNLGVGRRTGETFTGGPNNAWTGSYSTIYDPRGQVTGSSETINGTPYTMGFSYDDAGHVTTQTYPDGEQVSTGYTAEGWMASLATTFPASINNGASVTLVDHLGYSGFGGAQGNATSLGLNGQSGGTDTYTTALTYDALGRPTESKTTLTSSGATLYEDAPGYDAVGNVVSVSTSLPAGTDNQAFCYDDLNRLTWAGSTGTPACGGTLTAGTLTAAQYTATYAYDTLDRLTSGPLGTYTYGDSAHLHAATSVGSTWTGSYDAAGQLTCRAPTNTTTCATLPTGASLSYDAAGQLTHWQNTPTSPTSTDDFLYNGEGNRVLQQSSVGGATTTTTYLSNLEEVATTGGSTTTTVSYYLGGKRVAESVNGTVAYLLDDGLGSANVALDASGNVTASVLYGPYGQPRYSQGTMPGSYGFTGQHDDTATIGLDDYGARYYDPLIGQFASADPAGDGLDRYAYVGGNPETKTDPTGLDGGFFGGLVSAVSNVVQTVAPAAVQAVATVTGVSSMVSDVQTIVSTVQHGGSPLAVVLAVGDLALNVAMDASMVVGAGEGLRAAYIGLHAAADVGEHLAVEGVAHAAEGAAAHEAEDAAAHEAEQATASALESGADACGLSFAAGTLVSTPSGKQPIAALKVGDTVTAYDPTTGKATSEPVTRTFRNHDTDLLDVTLRTATPKTAHNATPASDGTGQIERGTAQRALATSDSASAHDETIHTTANHPWLTADRGWAQAGTLTPGEHVLRADGSTAVVVALHTVTGASPMYDLTVAQMHDFAVGSGAYVVHNCGDPEGQVKWGETELGKEVKAARQEPKDVGHNYAAARLDDGEIRVARSMAGDHAEEALVDGAEADGRTIEALYSERQPCAESCADYLMDHNPDMKVSWTWPWEGENPALSREIQRFISEQLKRPN